MTHDPWTVLPDIACPTCHAMGKIVVNSDDDEAYEGSESPSMCVECGQCFVDAGMLGNDSLKEARQHYMRRLEGMPYEPPKPKEPVKSKVDFSAYDSVLRDHYDLEGMAFGARAYALTMDTWKLTDGLVAMQDVDLDEVGE